MSVSKIVPAKCWTCGNRNLRFRIAFDLASYGYTRAKYAKPVSLSTRAETKCRAAGHDVRPVIAPAEPKP